MRYVNGAMKPLYIIILCLGLAACDRGPMVSGKSVSFWITQLDDLDEKSQLTAMQKLNKVDLTDLDRARPRLQEISKGVGTNAEVAGRLLAKLK